MFSDCQSELHELKNALIQYQYKSRPNSQDLVELDIENTTWVEVQEVIKAVICQEGSDDESNRAKTSCLRMAKNIPDFETWLNLLPAGDYGAVVSGVFKMVVGVHRSDSLWTALPHDPRLRNVSMRSGSLSFKP